MNYRIVGILFLVIFPMSITKMFAQEDKITPRVNLTFHHYDQEVPYVLINIRNRVERRFVPMEGIPVTVSVISGENEYDLGSFISNSNGLAKAKFPEELMSKWGSLFEAEFTASIVDTDSTEAVDETLIVVPARIRISTDDERLITAVVEKRIEGEWEAVPDVDVKFFIRRYFGRLIIGDDFYTTDENGAVELEFDTVIPGDAEGNIEISCLLEDNEDFGTISALTSQKWGTPFIDDNAAFEKRTLWSTRDKTPYWLLIFPNLMIVGVWGIIAYLVIQIIKIKKLQNHS